MNMSDRPATACGPPEALKLPVSGPFPLLFCNLEICSAFVKDICENTADLASC